MNIDRNKLYKGLALIAVLCVLVGCITQYTKHNSMTLSDYAAMHPELASGEEENANPGNPQIADSGTENADSADMNENLQNEEKISSESELTGAILNGESQILERVTYADSFYYEPLSDNLRRYITGVSYPASESNSELPDSEITEESAEISAFNNASSPSVSQIELPISYDDLRYVHVLHYDFEGKLAEGELICNSYIAGDLVEIFYELYYNEYQIEKIRLIDEYDGNDDASMEDNNTSCFNYRNVADSASLSKHALGLAIDINPLYNPYITYDKDGAENIAPASASAYADRERSFPYKIDENDLCYKLFTQHGFTWGGNWNSCKDYQHFQKTR